VVEAGIERADQLGPERAAEYLSHRGVAEASSSALFPSRNIGATRPPPLARRTHGRRKLARQ
jgi:hypothetical protein